MRLGSAVAGFAMDNLRRGFILRDDAVRTIVEAMQSEVGGSAKSHFDFDRDRDFGRD